MTTTSMHTSQGRARTAALPPFRTPVRGHAFAPRPPEVPDPVPGEAAALLPEPTNPADPHAVAVWVGEEGRRWRIGYLDRGVAARVAPRLRDGMVLRARIDGWTREPQGRWQRPVVLLRGELPVRAPQQRRSVRPEEARPAGGVWGRPPGVARRTLGPARGGGGRDGDGDRARR